MTERAATTALVDARRRHARNKRVHVLETVDAMVNGDSAITFTSVARAAGVSKWLVYAEGIKEYIEKAQSAQAARPRDQETIGARAGAASIRADLELALHKNRIHRDEIHRLKTLLRERLGAELSGETVHRLQSTIDTLRETNSRVVAERNAAVDEGKVLADRLRVAEDDLAAVRQSLRQMIRSQNESSET